MEPTAKSFEQAFPGLGSSAGRAARRPAVHGDECRLPQALEATGGELGDGQGAFREALRTREPNVPFGAIKLDLNRQMTGHSYLERAARDADGRVVLEPVRTMDGVEQTFDGIFTADDSAAVRRRSRVCARDAAAVGALISRRSSR